MLTTALVDLREQMDALPDVLNDIREVFGLVSDDVAVPAQAAVQAAVRAVEEGVGA